MKNDQQRKNIAAKRRARISNNLSPERVRRAAAYRKLSIALIQRPLRHICRDFRHPLKHEAVIAARCGHGHEVRRIAWTLA